MYVDKRLADIQAVQTLSRLNRGHKDQLICVNAAWHQGYVAVQSLAQAKESKSNGTTPILPRPNEK